MSELLHEEIDAALADWGDHPALVDATPGLPAHVLSADDLRTGYRDCADFLSRSGVEAGVPVALVLDNSMDFVRVFLALLRIGALPVPLKPDYRTLELDEIFANCAPWAVITESPYLDPLRPYLDGRAVISRSGGALRLDRAAARRPQPADVEGDVASLNYTYRGHGYPLASMVTHAQYLHGARVYQDALLGSRGERMLSILPMTHIFSLVSCTLVPLLFGMTAVIARTMHPRHLFRIIEEQRIDYITAVPEIYLLLARTKEEGREFPGLKALVSGGSALSAEEYETVRQAFGAEVLHGYGLTEFAPVSGSVRGSARAGTVGPLRGVEVRIDAPDPSGVGEILLRTSHMSRGYYRRPRETEEAFEGQWFHTGDLGKMEGDQLVFVAEKKRTCKVNGIMVDLEEVRRALLLDPTVVAADVYMEKGVLTARVGVTPESDSAAKTRELTESLRYRISAAKMPKRVVKTRPAASSEDSLLAKAI